METGVPPDAKDAFLSKSHELTVGIIYRRMQSAEGPWGYNLHTCQPHCSAQWRHFTPQGGQVPAQFNAPRI